MPLFSNSSFGIVSLGRVSVGIVREDLCNGAAASDDPFIVGLGDVVYFGDNAPTVLVPALLTLSYPQTNWHQFGYIPNLCLCSPAFDDIWLPLPIGPNFLRATAGCPVAFFQSELSNKYRRGGNEHHTDLVVMIGLLPP